MEYILLAICFIVVIGGLFFLAAVLFSYGINGFIDDIDRRNRRR